MTGYQLYVLDGKDFLLFKSALKFKLLDSNIQFDEFIPIQFRTMNAKLFARLNFDFGYARDPFYKTSNPYSNRSEYGYGPALDLIIYNNFTLSCELGITRFGEKGFFFESGFIF